jgi:hypothetical protein
MAAIFKRPRRDDNVIVLPRLGNQLPEEPAVDLDELVGLADYLMPARVSDDVVIDPAPEEIETITAWADGDAETMRQAWMLAVRRYGTHQVRRGAVELLATALHRAEEHASLQAPRRRRPTSQPSPRPRVAARTRQPSRRT